MPGRNDPCHCGSGKKYKKCCLVKDQERSPITPVLASASATPVSPRDFMPRPALRAPKPPEPPPDPETLAWQARWREFEAQDFDGKVRIYRETMADAEPVGDEVMFELLQGIKEQGRREKRRGELAGLVAELRGRHPELYRQSCQYYLGWLIEEALATGGDVNGPAREMATLANKDMDAVSRAVDQLEYAGRLPLLIEVAHIAWPDVKTGENIMSWAIGEFAQRRYDYEIFSHLETNPADDGRDPALLAGIGFFAGRLRRNFIAEHVTHLAGTADRTWRLDDFHMQPVPPRGRAEDDWDEDDDWDDEDDPDADDDSDDADDADADDADADDADADDADLDHNADQEQVAEPDAEPDAEEDPFSDVGRRNLFLLSAEFVGHLRRVEGVPYTRAEHARYHLVQYFYDRFDGKLLERPPLFERDRKPRAQPGKPLHPLCPDAQTLERYLSDLVGFMASRYHTAAALWEILPAWLRFLESRKLLEAELRDRVLRTLEGLAQKVAKLFQQLGDPILLRNLENAWPLGKGYVDQSVLGP